MMLDGLAAAANDELGRVGIAAEYVDEAFS